MRFEVSCIVITLHAHIIQQKECKEGFHLYKPIRNLEQYPDCFGALDMNAFTSHASTITPEAALSSLAQSRLRCVLSCETTQYYRTPGPCVLCRLQSEFL